MKWPFSIARHFCENNSRKREPMVDWRGCTWQFIEPGLILPGGKHFDAMVIKDFIDANINPKKTMERMGAIISDSPGMDFKSGAKFNRLSFNCKKVLRG